MVLIEPAQRVQGKVDNYLSLQQEKIKSLLKQGHDIIRVGRGSPDLETFPAIVTALKDAIDDPKNHGYPPYGGKSTLKDAITDFYSREYGVKLDQDEVTIFSGSNAVLTAIPMVLLNPGDIALVPDPAFFGYENGVRMAGGQAYYLPITEDNHFLPDYEKIPDDIKRRAKLLFLNYPNNPTDATATFEFYEATVRFAQENNIVVVQDFAYADISFTQKAVSFLEVPGAKEVGIEIYTFSKTFNMAGWRVAFASGNRLLIDLIRGYIRASVGGTFGAVQDAAQYGLEHSVKERQQLQLIYLNRFRVFRDTIESKNLSVNQSGGTFFVWLKLPEGVDDVHFADQLLEKKDVAAVPGSTFGKNGRGYLRVSLLVEKEVLIEVAKRIKELLSEEFNYEEI